MPRSEEFEAVLQRHVLDVWFPRCLDQRDGGYLCDFSRTWSPAGPHHKLLEFQARHLCVAAEAHRRYPEDARFREATRHGFRFLQDVLWDREAGGWFHLVDREGRSLEGATKHAHGIAYALDACAAVYQATGDPAALALAQTGFRWLDAHAHDRRHGGWFGPLTRDGAPIVERPDPSRPASDVDAIGTPFGLKDLNVHSDLLETFQRLWQVWPDPVLAERLEEIVEIVARKLTLPTVGATHFYCTADWQPVPHLVRTGYQFQVAFRLTMTPDLCGRGQELQRIACTVMNYTRSSFHDPAGGYFYAGVGEEPRRLQGFEIGVRDKAWWVQFEALKALLAVSRFAPDPAGYLREFAAQWRYIQAAFLDAREGGIYTTGLDRVPRIRRALGPGFAPHEITRKGHVWKDARHDAHSLLYCMDTVADPASGG